MTTEGKALFVVGSGGGGNVFVFVFVSPVLSHPSMKKEKKGKKKTHLPAPTVTDQIKPNALATGPSFKYMLCCSPPQKCKEETLCVHSMAETVGGSMRHSAVLSTQQQNCSLVLVWKPRHSLGRKHLVYI